MLSMLLMSIFIAAALSLLSYIYCWHDIKSGKPHIISLRQITNVMDRNRLNQMFGTPDRKYRYTLSPQMLALFIRRRQVFYYSEVAADSICLIGAYFYMTGQLPMTNVGWFILLAGICQAINFVYSIRLVRRWSHQIREEMDGDDLDE